MTLYQLVLALIGVLCAFGISAVFNWLRQDQESYDHDGRKSELDKLSK